MLGFSLLGATGAQQPLVWTPLHEPACGGWVTSLAVSPHDKTRVLVGGDILGIGLSFDGGDSWTGTSGLRNWEIADFTWHPSDTNLVWAGTLGGPYLSADGGCTWTPRRAGMPAVNGGRYSVPIQKILFDPNGPTRLLAFGGNHREMGYHADSEWGVVWESLNAGATWARKGTVKADGNIMSAGFAAGSSTRLYAAVDDYGVCVSEDGGTTWRLQTNGLPSENVKDLAVHPTAPLTAYAAMWNKSDGLGGYNAGGVWMTTNGGTNWVSRNTGLRRNSGTDPNFVAKYKTVTLHPANPNWLVTSDCAWDNPGVYASTNGGLNWTRYSAASVAMPAGGNFTGLEFDPADPRRMFAFSSEYVLRSTNGGATWNDLSSFVVSGQPGFRGTGYAGWVTTRYRWHPTDWRRSIFAGLDHGFGWQSRNGLQSWKRGSGLPTWGGASDVTWGAGDSVYIAHGQFGSSEGVARSLDGGVNYSMLKGSALGLPTNGVPQGIYAQPGIAGDVWVCWNGLRHTTNHGASWSLVTAGTDPRWLAASPENPALVYVSCADGIYRTTDGLSFSSIGGPAEATRLTVDTLGRVWALNWRATGGGLWRFAGGKWTKIRSDAYLADVAVGPANPRRLMAVSNDHPYHDETFATGVWTSEDDGVTWKQQNFGLAQLRVECVAVSPQDPDLWIVGTGGRGYFITRWADLVIRREGADLPPRWRILGPPNRAVVLESSPDLRQWNPQATNTLPAEGWVFDASPAESRFYRARAAW